MKHMYEAHEAHLAHPAHYAHSAMSMLDCPNDFHITPLTKLGELEKFAHHICTHITSKRIELESPGWSGFVIN